MVSKNWMQILSKAGCAKKQAEEWSGFYAKYCNQYQINTPKRVAAFIANVVIESQYLRILRENLKYSAQGLARTWPNRYSSTGKRGGSPNAKALSIAGKPVAIANHCYANRMGNGDESSGDGWRYCGKGPIQLTGKSNFTAFFKSAKVSDTDPEKLVAPEMGALSSVWFWTSNNINQKADIGDFDGCCDLVNIGRKTRELGDAHGYAQRKAVYDKLLAFLNANPNLLKYTPEKPEAEQVVQVVSEKEMEEVIPPEVTWVEQDPDNEYGYDHVNAYQQI